jgi:hypothetical protein
MSEIWFIAMWLGNRNCTGLDVKNLKNIAMIDHSLYLIKLI